MSSASSTEGQRDQRCNGAGADSGDNESMFRLLFERSGDAIILFDPQKQALVDCNDAAVRLMRAPSKERLLSTSLTALAPASQADGRCTQDALKAITGLISGNGGPRFVWLARRFVGRGVPVGNTVPSIPGKGRVRDGVVPPEISEGDGARRGG